jgi:hypothetical protein
MYANEPAVIEREARAVSMRAAGKTYAVIANDLQVSRGVAYKLVSRALMRIVTPPSEEVRRAELAHIEILFERCFDMAHGRVYVDEDGEVSARLAELSSELCLKAIDRCVKLMDRKAKLLGLDAPTRSEVITVDSLDAEIARLEAELATQTGAFAPEEQEEVMS